MVVTDCLLFEQAAQELLPHAGHKVSIISEGGETAPEAVGVICEDCQTVLLDFASSERPDADRVKYEAHYDAGRDVCHVEVFKPGKSHTPTGATGHRQPFPNWNRLGLRRKRPRPVRVRHFDGLPRS